jgi:hypothetical protein
MRAGGFVDIVVQSKKNRIEDSSEILRAAQKRPIPAQVCSEWARKSGCAALRMTVPGLYEWKSTVPDELETELNPAKERQRASVDARPIQTPVADPARARKNFALKN